MRDAIASDAEATMRTTLDIDDDVLFAAKEIARDRKTTAGKVISDCARKGMTSRTVKKFKLWNGIPQIPTRPGARKVTLELVNRLRDDEYDDLLAGR
jgi:hypothetical protein